MITIRERENERVPNVREQETISRRGTHPDLTKWQLTGEDLFEEVRLKLEGKRYVFEDGEAIGTKTVGKQLFPDKVIDEIMSILNMYINKNMQLADFTSTEIHQIMKFIMKDIGDYFKIVYMEYDEVILRDVIIGSNICNFIWGALSRAKDAGEKRFISETETRTRRFEERPEKKESLLKRLSPI